MIKIIFSDFDETMLNYYSKKNYFDSYQLGVLKRLKDRGIKFSIVTGRSVSFFDQFPELLSYVSYIIASNGSCIYDVENKRNIYQKYIGFQEVYYLLDYVKNHQYKMDFNSDGMQYSNDLDVDLKKCEQVIISVPKDSLKNVIEDISTVSYISFNNICMHDDRYAIDINDSHVSKGNGIIFLCNYLNIDLDDTICFGDSNNDVSMFQVVGKGFSVGNASDKIKVLANKITLSSRENGIFKYIDENILK